jgi:hypothetical protein
VQLGRNRLLEEEVAEAALTYRRAVEGDEYYGAAGRHLDMALGRLHRAPNPGRPWPAPEAVTPGREAPRDVLGGLTSMPPVVGTLTAGRVSRDRAGVSDGAFTTARKASAPGHPPPPAPALR